MAQALPAPTQAIRGHFVATASISAEGRATVEGIEGVQEPVANAVRSQLEALEYVAAHENGAPVSREVFIVGDVRLEDAGQEGYRVVVMQPAVRMVQIVSSVLPRYSTDELRKSKAGHVVLLAKINEAGNVVDIEVIEGGERGFEKISMAAIRRWKFETRGREAEVMLPVWFHMDTLPEAALPPVFSCPALPAQPAVKGQSNCMERIEVVGSKRRRAIHIPGG